MKSKFLELRVLLAIISIFGMLTTSFLIYQHYFGSKFCNISERISCDIVNKSEYSEIFGVPVAALGLIYFLFVDMILFMTRTDRRAFLYLFYATIPILIYSYYLTAIELFVLNAVCIFCEFTKVLIVSILVISFIELRKENIL